MRVRISHRAINFLFIINKIVGWCNGSIMGSSPKGIGSSPIPAIFTFEPDEFFYYICIIKILYIYNKYKRGCSLTV